MSKTNNPGINWAGPGSAANTNPETGVRYGIISSNAVNGDALNDIYTHGTDEDYESFIEARKAEILSALGELDYDEDEIKSMADAAFDAISDSLGDSYQGTGDCTGYSYEAGGYSLAIDSGGDLWVFGSPYFTYAQFCSPCAPGACHLDSPLDLALGADELPIDPPASNKCYCLGPDWFDDESPCPYPVYSVETGKLVVKE